MKNQMPNIPLINPLELHMIGKGIKPKPFFHNVPIHINCRCIVSPIKKHWLEESFMEHIKGKGQIFLEGDFDEFFREIT